MSDGYDILLEKYQSLQFENRRLQDEIKRLEQLIGDVPFQNSDHTISSEINPVQNNLPEAIQTELFRTIINNYSGSKDKIQLFMSLFKGRNDVFAHRWENNKKGSSGYSPSCNNEWLPGICKKPKITCSNCAYKQYTQLNEQVIENHLRGTNNQVIGIYPLLQDETCYFLAIDFDDEGWQKDISTLRQVCHSLDIPIAVERSRSGKGAHAWFFFEQPLPALIARKFGSGLLTYAMNKQHDISFKSYDRLFPNQDTMPKGGFGNLIALPLQKAARANGNSEFIDESFKAYQDQWAFLSSIIKLSENTIDKLISILCQGNELGNLKIDNEEEPKPWEKAKIELSKNDFPETVSITEANMLFVEKVGLSQRALNQIKRLAAFKNPEFFKAQAMRLSTFNKPRIISCTDEINDYLCLPRGCKTDLTDLLQIYKVNAIWADETNNGRHIDVIFKGELRGEQPIAVEKLLANTNGILCGTTAFGKTIAAINLIAKRKVNTLILVNRVSLVTQWKEKINEFLSINELLPENCKAKKGENQTMVGQLGGGKNQLTGIIDVAVMQSLSRNGEVDSRINNYGMVIIDECHHISAFSFELILKNVKARFIYGLTATPTRKDGHHPIITMQCGPIRFRDDAKLQASARPFDHFVIPRFTTFRNSRTNEKDTDITRLYAEIITDAIRNQQIIDDVIQSYKDGKNCILLTERTNHVKFFTQELNKQIDYVFALCGQMGIKETRETISNIERSPKASPIIIIATGRYIGEGFDEPRLDTLFLAMPISWKGTLQQYVGRLHRLFETKKEVIVYDYVDIHEPMFEKMYHKRLAGYASIGYKAKGEILTTEPCEIIYDHNSFQPVFFNDLNNATREILIVSPFITQKRVLQLLKSIKAPAENPTKVTVITRPHQDDKKASKSIQESLEILRNSGIDVITKSSIHQKFCIIDHKVVWYGSINLLGYGNSEESMMRLVSSGIAFELTNSISI